MSATPPSHWAAQQQPTSKRSPERSGQAAIRAWTRPSAGDLVGQPWCAVRPRGSGNLWYRLKAGGWLDRSLRHHSSGRRSSWSEVRGGGGRRPSFRTERGGHRGQRRVRVRPAHGGGARGHAEPPAGLGPRRVILFPGGCPTPIPAARRAKIRHVPSFFFQGTRRAMGRRSTGSVT